MMLPSPALQYDASDEAHMRQTVEQELLRLRAELQTLRDALAKATVLPIVVRN